jgi:hypothetical protein
MRAAAALKSQLFYYMRGHAAAALIQQAQQPESGYARYIYYTLPTYYLRLLRHSLRAEFPHYQGRTRTLWVEIKGMLSGIAFYHRHRARARTSPPRP